MGEQTYYILYDLYTGIVESLPESMFTSAARPAPPELLSLGSEGEDVRFLQEYINVIASVYPEIPSVTVNGIYDQATVDAVTAFQSFFDIPVPNPGITSFVTWNAIGDLYDDIIAGRDVQIGQYPGFVLSE